MVCYIHCKINGREIMINEDDSYDIKMLSTSKIPKWRQVKIQTYTQAYKYIHIGNRKFSHHRVIYYAHNKDFDILDVSKKNYLDHINRDRADNNISNLRVVTAQQNQFNIGGKGYSWCKRDNKWCAEIGVNFKSIYLGRFVTEEEARNAYLEAKKIYHIMPVQESSSAQEKPKPFSKKPS